jgi:PelA/Pel-15E family pectate lyase
MPQNELLAACLALTLSAATIPAAVLGTSKAAQSLTPDRIATLPRKPQTAWKAYLKRSAQQEKADRAFLAAEVAAAGLKEPITPPNGFSTRGMPLNRPAEWYAGADARRVADIVVSFQTPAGGWSKNLNLTDHVRRKGEHFAPDNLSRRLTPSDFDAPSDPAWNYVGTLDNDATTTEMQFLARVVAALGASDGTTYRKSFLRGIDYLLAAQFPNGGWPQVWPLEGGYHDSITFNDGAVVDSMRLLDGVAGGGGIFAFVPPDVRKRAATAVTRGLECILASQIVVDGRLTAWGQQHDPLTLAPASGRNYEPAALCSAESADVVLFLMELPNPTPPVIRAADAAIAWLRKSAIRGQKYVRGAEGGRLEPASNESLIWARFYQIGSDRPIFGDRDKSIHDRVDELSMERRRGYKWYTTDPQSALKTYENWQAHLLSRTSK